MGLIYNATAANGKLTLLSVMAGDFVSVRGIGNPSNLDAQGRMPHLLYIPGGINQQCMEPAHYDVPLPPTVTGDAVAMPEYRDDGGAVYFPLPGAVYIAGGAGEWDFSVVFRRGRACEQVQDYRYKITSYTTAGVRLSGIVPPHGAEYVELFDTGELVLTHGTTTTSFAAAPAGKYYLQQVNTIAWMPLRNAQLIIHGRM